MSSNNTHIGIYRGDSYPISFTFKDKVTKKPLDFTGCSLIMTVDLEENPTDDSTKVFSVPGTLDSIPTSGIVRFIPTSLNTTNIGDYFYDIQLTDIDGHVRTIAKSTFSIAQDITK